MNQGRKNDYFKVHAAALARDKFMAFAEREANANKYAWAVPSEDALVEIAKHTPLIEMGAGSGYWAHLLQERGVDIIAYDKDPLHLGTNHFHKEVMPWTHVLQGTPVDLKAHADRTLFLCWPPYDDPMAADCLLHYRGNTVIYVGEGHGGCTGDDAFHDALERDWLLEKFVNVPQWYGINDFLAVYKRNNFTRE